MTKYLTISEELNQLPRERQEALAAIASQICLEEITAMPTAGFAIALLFTNKREPSCKLKAMSTTGCAYALLSTNKRSHYNIKRSQ